MASHLPSYGSRRRRVYRDPSLSPTFPSTFGSSLESRAMTLVSSPILIPSARLIHCDNLAGDDSLHTIAWLPWAHGHDFISMIRMGSTIRQQTLNAQSSHRHVKFFCPRFDRSHIASPTVLQRPQQFSSLPKPGTRSALVPTGLIDAIEFLVGNIGSMDTFHGHQALRLLSLDRHGIRPSTFSLLV